MTGALGARALGLSHNDPLRGPVALQTLSRVFAVAADADGAGVASIVDGAALLSHQRLEPGSASLASVIGTPKGRTAVAQFSTPRELRPAGAFEATSRGPYRARAWAAAVVGGPQDPDEAAAIRERLVADLPDPLRRCLVGKSEAEARFLAILAVLHRRGLLDRAHDNGPQLLDAVLAVDDGRHPRQLTLTNGVDVLHVARGLPSAVVIVRGLDDDVAADVSPMLADSSTARERNRRYLGVFCVGALDAPLRSDATMPTGCEVTRFADGGACLVGRDLVPRTL
jgi:hypothetical protein